MVSVPVTVDMSNRVRFSLEQPENTTQGVPKKYRSEISGSEIHMKKFDRFAPCQIILDTSENFEPFLHFELFFGPFGPLFDHLRLFGSFWTVLTILDRFGPLRPFWTVWTNLTILNYFGPFGHFGQFWTMWTVLDRVDCFVLV